MQCKGINSDTGFLSAGTSTREPFEAEVVRREMRIIRHERYADMPWEPKAAFTTLADRYSR